MARISHFIVYALEVIMDGLMHIYVGITGVLTGISDRRALEGRKQWHESDPVHCLADVIPHATSVKIRTIATNIREKSDALVDEVSVIDLGTVAFA